jgi:hypothetical protein
LSGVNGLGYFFNTKKRVVLILRITFVDVQ